MSHRIDRSLGVKPYCNAQRLKDAEAKSWNLKLTTVLKVALVLLLGAIVYSCVPQQCQPEVRCAD